jgi:cold-inducible RNA-binding protein
MERNKLVMGKKLYVGNLGKDVDESALRAAFSEYGTVDCVNIVVCGQTRQSAGYGFVEMGSPSDAAKASALDGTDMGGSVVKVEEARPPRVRRSTGKRHGGRERG